MAERVMPRDALNQKTVMADDDQQTVYNKTQNRNDNAEFSDMRTYYEERLKDGTTQMNPRSFTSGRFDSEELASGTLSVSGWYTIAELANVTANRGGAIFRIHTTGGSRGDMLKFEVSFGANSTARTFENTHLEILSKSFRESIQVAIQGVRIAKSDSAIDAGAKIQINLNIDITLVTINQMTQNLGNALGWELVTPFLDNTPTLPDGVTAGTFLEAGAEIARDYLGNATFEPRISCFKASNDILRVAVDWGKIPKLGTGITITEPSTNLSVVDGEGTVVTLAFPLTILLISIKDNVVQFQITDTGHFTTLNNGPVGMIPNGSGFKIKIDT